MPKSASQIMYSIINIKDRSHTAGIIFITLTLALGTAIVYFTGGTKYAYTHIMYIPALLAGILFGIKGGLLGGIIGGLLLGPLMPVDVATGETQLFFNWLTRLSFFTVIGLISGLTVQTLSSEIAKNKWLATHFPDTNLPNRSALLDYLGKIMNKNNGRLPDIYLAILSNTNTTDIQNNFGYDAEQEITLQLYNRLNERLPDSSKIFQIRNDQIVLVLFPEKPGKFNEHLNIITKATSEPFIYNDIEIFTENHIGYVSSFQNPLDPKELFRKARIALAYAVLKNIEKVKYTTNIDLTSTQSTTMLRELKQAIQNNQLQLAYQPVINVNHKKNAGIECLLRWQHPEKGTIRPAAFLAKSQTTNLNKPISYKTIKLALDFIHEYALTDILDFIAINVTTANLQDNEFNRLLQDSTYKHRIPPQKISLEITEADIMLDPEKNIQTINEYANLGFLICIDNFGQTNSCLHYLNRIPAAMIKIDRLFLKGIATDEKLKLIIQKTIQLCHELNIKVITAGIEDYSKLMIIQQLECDLAQGYLICPPLNKDQTLEWINDNSKIAEIF